MKRPWWAPAALLTGVAVLLTGCTGIPTSSSPQVIRSVDRGDGPASNLPNLAPVIGAGPRDIVAGFLTAVAKSPDAGHSAARQFLTSSAARKWQDDTTTVVLAHQVGAEVPARGAAGPRTQSEPGSVTVAVTGRPLEQLDAGGVFSPVLTGNGTGDTEVFNYTLTRSDGQWRIDQLPSGVLIDQASFGSYQQRKLYFFDSAERVLVPDLRYSPLSGQALESWLLTQLLAGPRPELQQSVTTEVPEQVGKSSVVVGDLITVELAGAAQLDNNSRNHLAAQLAYTLGPSEFRPLRLTDSGHTVQIPLVAGPTFGVNDFQSLDPDLGNRSYKSYFIRDGAVIDGLTNTPMAGLLGQSARNLTSVALQQRGPSDVLHVAGVSNGSLMLGTSTDLSRVALPAGALSRPEWRPNSDEAWIGVGSKGAIYRVRAGQSPALVQITSPLGGGLPGQVLALRFSPDGARLAAVVRGPSGIPAAWIGSVAITSNTDIRINAFEPITPALLSVTDLSWGDSSKLYLIDSTPGNDDSVDATYSDGYSPDSGVPTNVGLSGIPTSIAAAPGEPPLVSAADSIQSLPTSAGSWVNYPNTAAGLATSGANPVYGAQ